MTATAADNAATLRPIPLVTGPPFTRYLRRDVVPGAKRTPSGPGAVGHGRSESGHKHRYVHEVAAAGTAGPPALAIFVAWRAYGAPGATENGSDAFFRRER